MAENSAISWTRHTWNPWMGCTKISPACDGCYAEALMDKRYHKVQWGNAPRVRTSKHTWNDPFRWQRQAEQDGDRPFVFCASLADIFDNQVDPQWRADAFEVMRKTPRLVYLLLTKRPQNIIKLASEAGGLPSNAAIGTTIEDQARTEINVPALLNAKRATKPLFAFVSCEPLLGQINLHWIALRGTNGLDALRGVIGMDDDTFVQHERIDWVITGGETDQGGHKSRPTNPRWFRSLRDQCEDAGVSFHHKQNGEWVSVSEVAGAGEHFSFDDGATVRRVGKKLSGRTIDGITHDEFPEIRT
ncbi:DUF5131 family protein [Rhizobium sp. ZK1]|uniref:DUF5131 family protein n=1 Tax=Rhizobium sp. ZK1 TaxID=3389872 RepID=UPI0039F6D4B0